MKILLPLFFVTISALVSCGYKASNDTTALPEGTAQVPAGFPTVGNDSTAPVSGNVPAQTTQSQTSSPASAGTNAAAGLNPAHGQPGHRCEIAVGAPLDSKPTVPTTTTTPTTQASQPTTITSTPVTQPGTQTPAKTAAGLNPAHGQPGHRCDIAVGAPLDSKPTTSTTPVNTTPTNTATPVIGNSPLNVNQSNPVSPMPVTPIIPAGNTKPTANATGAGMNPAHGQPGHRCDIAVGAPLNSKPAATPTKQ